MRLFLKVSAIALLVTAFPPSMAVEAADEKSPEFQRAESGKRTPAARRRRIFKDVRRSKTPVAAKSAVTAKKSTIEVKETPRVETGPSVASGVMNWLTRMKARIAASRARSNQVVAVAAVRGDETPDAPPLYWKGAKPPAPAKPAEIEAFDAALNAALSGDAAGASSRLEAFLAAHPKSGLADDARETLGRLRPAR